MTSAQKKLITTPTEYLARLVNGQTASYTGRAGADLKNKHARGSLEEFQKIVRQEHSKPGGLRICGLVGFYLDGSTIDLPLPDDWLRAPSVAEPALPANDELAEVVPETAQDEPQDAQAKEPSSAAPEVVEPDSGAIPPLLEKTTTPTTLNISNAQFAQEMFGNLAHGTFCWTTSFTPHPKEADGKDWGGRKTLTDEIQNTPHGNAYISIASFKFGADKTVKKDNQHFAALHLLVLDDTKSAAIKPTYKLETSLNNFQLGFKLSQPVTDVGIAERLHKEIAKADLGNDKSGNMAVRYARLVVGCNTKAQPPFPCKLHAYAPEITYTLEQLIDAFEFDGNYILNGGEPNRSNAPANIQTNNVVSIDDETISDLYSALKYLPADNRDPWAGKIGHALKTLGEVGRDLFIEWSKSSKKFDPADADRVWKSFKPTEIGYRAVFAEAKEQGWLNPRSNAAKGAGSGEQGAGGDDKKERHLPVEMSEVTLWSDNKKNPVPEELTKFPTPRLNAFCNWFDRSAEDTVRGVSIVGVIHLASITVSRGAQSCKRNCAGLFLALIARTGFGKNYSKNSPKKILRAAGVCFDISGSFTSASAIYSALRRCPSATFHLDELGDRLKNGFQDKGGLMPAAWQFTKEVYSSTHDALEKPSMGTSGLTTKQLADHKKVNLPAHNPVLNILGLTTPDQLWIALDNALVEGGFINRFVMVDIDVDQVFENPEPEYDPPAKLVEHIRKVRTYLGGAAVSMLSNHEGADELLKTDPVYSNPDAPADFKIYTFDAESLRLLDQFKKEIKQRYGRDSFMESVSARWRENAMRMALGLAVFDDPEREQIPVVITQWCIDYVYFYGKRFAAGLTRQAQPVELYGKARKAFLLAFQDKPEGTSASDLGRLNPWRNSQPRQRAEIIDDLLNAGLIKKVYQDIDSRKSRGPRAWRYFALSD